MLNVYSKTQDKISLLGLEEIANVDLGFSADVSDYDTERRVLITDYCRATGGSFKDDEGSNYYGFGYWTLRSPSDDYDGKFCYVSYVGAIYEEYGNVTDTDFGIVPLIEITL